MSFVRTVLGDILASEMGVTYSHEHIVIEEGFVTLGNPEFTLNNTTLIINELKEVYSLGGRTMVDTMPAACGRNILKLAEVSKASGVNIIAPTGIHLEKYYPPNHWRYHLTVQQLTELFIEDIESGIDELDYNSPVIKRTPYKAGMIKLATGDGKITSHQRKIFEAVVNAHRKTGAPILTHTNGGNLAMEQVELFAKLGADLGHVVISHVDKNRDLVFHHDLLQTGVYVEYDSHFRMMAKGDDWTYKLFEHILPKFSNRIVAGMDLAKNTYWKSYGGTPGLAYLLTKFKGDFKNRGLEQYLNVVLVENPKELYSLYV